MNDEKLICLVESYKELYDKGNPYYKFHGRKRSIWEQIGVELHTTGEECMRRWTTLRDRYGREIRKSAAPSGSAADFHRPWYLLENMKFLKPHVTSRPTRCSQNICAQTVNCVPSPMPSPSNICLDSQFVSVPSPSPPAGLSVNSPSQQIFVSMPSPSPPGGFSIVSPSQPLMVSIPSPSPPACVSVSSPSPSTSSNQVASPLPPSPAPRQLQRPGGKKRGRNDDVDKSMLEAIEIFKKKVLEEEGECLNPTVDSFGKMMVSMISKMSAPKQTRAMQRMMEVAFQVQQEPE